MDAARKIAQPPPPPASAPKASAPVAAVAVAEARERAVPGDVKGALYQALADMGCNFTADAVEASEVNETNGELCFVTGVEFKVAMSESDLRKAAQQALGKPYRIKVTIGTPAQTTPVATARPAAAEDELMQRAVADPAVQSFREAFPGAEIRHVRNLKEG